MSTHYQDIIDEVLTLHEESLSWTVQEISLDVATSLEDDTKQTINLCNTIGQRSRQSKYFDHWLKKILIPTMGWKGSSFLAGMGMNIFWEVGMTLVVASCWTSPKLGGSHQLWDSFNAVLTSSDTRLASERFSIRVTRVGFIPNDDVILLGTGNTNPNLLLSLPL